MKNDGFDELIHAPNRLRICSFLSTVEEAEFKVLREELNVSDSVLSKQIKLLEESGHLTVRKEVVKTGQRTWIGLSDGGKVAFANHVKELKRLIRGKD